MRCCSHATSFTSYTLAAGLTWAGRGHDALLLGCQRLLMRLLPPLPHLLPLQLPHFLHAASSCAEGQSVGTHIRFQLAPLLHTGMQEAPLLHPSAAASSTHQYPGLDLLLLGRPLLRCRPLLLQLTHHALQTGVEASRKIELTKHSDCCLHAVRMLASLKISTEQSPQPLASRAYLQRRDEAYPVDGRLCHELILHLRGLGGGRPCKQRPCHSQPRRSQKSICQGSTWLAAAQRARMVANSRLHSTIGKHSRACLEGRIPASSSGAAADTKQHPHPTTKLHSNLTPAGPASPPAPRPRVQQPAAPHCGPPLPSTGRQWAPPPRLHDAFVKLDH